MDPQLPDDVITDILERVPDSISLFRCSVVCKQWRRLVDDPVFLRRRRWPESTSQSSLLGFFVQRHRTNFSAQSNINSPNLSPAFVPAPPGDSVLGPGRRLLSSFVRDDARILDKAKPLAARGGLVLVRVAPRSSEKNNILRLSVCNLLTGKLERLPTLDASLLDGNGVRGYGLIVASDYNDDDDAPQHQRLAHGYSTLFQVLLIGFGQDGHLYLFRFSSAVAGSRRWCTYDCKRLTRGELYGCSNAAIANGTARWLFRGNTPTTSSSCFYTLDVSVNTGHISATIIPLEQLPHGIRHDWANFWLCTVDAKPTLLCLLWNQQLRIWSQVCQDGALAWHLTRFIHLDTAEWFSLACVGENSGTVLALSCFETRYAYVVDLQSGSATKMQGWTSSFNDRTAVPFEINWPMFFMSRLGVQI
ncbi:hypothetical protein PR202_gb25441 [Eleusine coracana subsp. coracana]|uniref:F-box domain-containing protein n=1 Tax=Eleusine coracana subsp. coracana TaxID=191504 RepID=A0AAV5FPJ5_ELECO|nr:hypothetical protein QOZ80_8BG0652220 [Eleusine coracana subsp. coracana]GJN36567.1 hypothetical protein PR202_gb25441 [Eleusine coracana subsp. coracana]